jgi:hypothetical protein
MATTINGESVCFICNRPQKELVCSACQQAVLTTRAMDSAMAAIQARTKIAQQKFLRASSNFHSYRVHHSED